MPLLIIIFIQEIAKREIYKKFKSEPKKWTFNVLAQHYGMSIDRVKAVIFLQDRREELMKSEELPVDGALPPAWVALYEKHLEDKTLSHATLAEAVGGFEGGEQEVARVLPRVVRHMQRQQNVIDNEEHFGAMMERMEEMGIDTTFKETASERIVKRGSGISGNLKDNYFPSLFGDDEGYEVAKVQLLNRLLKETRAIPEKDLAHYVDTFQAPPTPSTPIDNTQSTTPPVQEFPVSKWKFAFRDLTQLSEKTSTLPTSADRLATVVPTMIRTRTGG